MRRKHFEIKISALQCAEPLYINLMCFSEKPEWCTTKTRRAEHLMSSPNPKQVQTTTSVMCNVECVTRSPVNEKSRLMRLGAVKVTSPTLTPH